VGFGHQHTCQIDIPQDIVIKIDIDIRRGQTRQRGHCSFLTRQPSVGCNLKVPFAAALFFSVGCEGK
jgi:hypothetical protein